MEQNGIFNDKFKSYVDSWAEMQIKIWERKMAQYGVGDSLFRGEPRRSTGNLKNSLDPNVSPERDRIDFSFKFYGYYVEAGIGPEFGATGKLGKTRNSLGQFSENPERQPKPWLSGSYWYSRKKLMTEMIEETGRYYLAAISNILTTEKK